VLRPQILIMLTTITLVVKFFFIVNFLFCLWLLALSKSAFEVSRSSFSIQRLLLFIYSFIHSFIFFKYPSTECLAIKEKRMLAQKGIIRYFNMPVWQVVIVYVSAAIIAVDNVNVNANAIIVWYSPCYIQTRCKN